MSLAVGSRLASYQITGLLGAGGMGEVYQAHDTKLNRDVAIKVLPDEFANNPERIARFHREAQAVAALNHPNIAAIYEFAESDDARFLVLELVEGQTLAERLRRGALPVEEALQIARQICEALETAHDKGIVHRDLKPANIKITPEGKVKVLDFGLAKARENTAGSATMSNSPTLSLAGTVPGIILGTAAYMSPEQAKGSDADHRSDIFSFGCILYEMLTGRQAFDGDSISEILASVLKSEVDLQVLPSNLNPRIPELLRRCLEKNPKRRWHAAADVRVEIEGWIARNAFTTDEPQRPQFRPIWKGSLLAASCLVIGVMIGGVTVWNLRPSPPASITRFPFFLPEGQQFVTTGNRMIAISQDGSQIIYHADRQLYRRSMSDLEARPISGTQSAQALQAPAFSPDGRSVVFYSLTDRALKRIAVDGGAAVTVCAVDTLYGVSWSESGIIFGQARKGIMRVVPSGGTPEVLVPIKENESASTPRMLPDGKTIMFTLGEGTASPDSWDRARIVVQRLGSDERKVIIEGGSDAQYVPTGHVVYAFAGTLRAVPFDLRNLEVRGAPVPIVEGVGRTLAEGVAQYAFSDTGSLIYIPGSISGLTDRRDLAVFDRKGAIQTLKLPPGPKETPRFSPDGKLVAYGVNDGKDAAVWIYELSGDKAPLRLTFGGRNRFPIWSADGRYVAFQSDRAGDLAIFWQRADGSGGPERLTRPEKDAAHIPESWAPNNEQFLFSNQKGSRASLWTFSVKDKKATAFGSVESGIQANSVFSPDGKWVAYGSNETGTPEVFVQPFPITGAKYLLPRSQLNHHPLWSADGKELFYVPGPGQAAVVSFTTQPNVSFGNPVPVPAPINQGGSGNKRQTDVDLNGRFVGAIRAEQLEAGTPALQIQVVLNWFEDLRRRLP